jgi:cardiolipin synthase (CMP-forming)
LRRETSEPIFTVANQLTMVRMALVPVFVVLVLGHEFSWALVVFVVAGLTDALDGWVARHTHQTTRLGQMLDPVADKLLAGSAFVLMTWSSSVACPIPVWLTVTLLFRDGMLVVAVVIVNLTIGPRVFAPSWLGKLSTAFNVAAGAAALATNAMGECPPALNWLYGTTLALLVASTAHYVYQASEKPQRAAREAKARAEASATGERQR